ncbi:hypothetical protein Pd630_LPD04003 [Rhodococcus opacus PD630]|nr:hypothetical protein Pd630_LPD04003 [Rhodococcus opacus PD630]
MPVHRICTEFNYLGYGTLSLMPHPAGRPGRCGRRGCLTSHDVKS